MSQLSLFLIEVGVCLFASGLLVVALTGPMRRLLVDACGTAERASFWVVYCDAMFFILPLLAVVAFGKSTEMSGPTLGFYKAALGSALLGVFVALAVIGIQIAGFLPRRATIGKSSIEP
jgi:hypothetical protein